MALEATNITIEQECRLVLLNFLDAVDGKRFEEAVSYLTEDCHVAAPGATTNGRSEFLADLRARPAEMISRHFLTNFRLVSADDRTAVSLSYMQIYHRDVPQPFLVDLRDEYVQTSDGWKIKSKVGSLAF